MISIYFITLRVPLHCRTRLAASVSKKSRDGKITFKLQRVKSSNFIIVFWHKTIIPHQIFWGQLKHFSNVKPDRVIFQFKGLV